MQLNQTLTIFIGLLLVTSCAKIETPNLNEFGLAEAEMLKKLDVEAGENKKRKIILKTGQTLFVESFKTPKVEYYKDFILIRPFLNEKKRIDCFLYIKKKNFGEHLNKIYEKLLIKKDVARVLKIETGAIDQYAFFKINSFLKDQRGKFYNPKIVSYRHGEKQITCSNSDLGHQKTFDRITDNLLLSIDERNKLKVFYQNIYSVKQNSQSIGVVVEDLVKNQARLNIFRQEKIFARKLKNGELEFLSQYNLESLSSNFDLLEVLYQEKIGDYLKKQTTLIKQDAGLYQFILSESNQTSEEIIKNPKVESTVLLRANAFRYLNSDENEDELDKDDYRSFVFFPDYKASGPTEISLEENYSNEKYFLADVKFDKEMQLWRFDLSGNLNLIIRKFEGKKTVFKSEYLKPLKINTKVN